MFVIATVRAPFSRASFIAWIVSRVSPDCEMPITSVPGIEHRVAVDPFAGDIGLDGNARPFLDHVPADDACVVSRSARDDHDPPQVAQLVLVHPEPFEHEMAVADAVADRLGDTLGLFVDLLEHERLVSGTLGGGVVPVDIDGVVVDSLARLGVDIDHAVGGDPRDVTVVGELDATCLGEERREIGGEEVLAFTEPDDERRLVAHADELARMVAMDDDEGEVALETLVGDSDSFDEIALIGVLDQVRDDFGVRLRAERVPCREQLFAPLAVVLDDAVEDDREPTVVAGGERVRVLLRDAAVCRPARVAEAGRRDRSEPFGRELQVLEVADGAEVGKPVVLEQGEAGRVIAAVLEPLEPAQEERLCGARAGVSDDPAHFVASSTRMRMSETGLWKRKSPAADPFPSSGSVSRALDGREPRS